MEPVRSGVRIRLEVHPGSARSGVEGVNPWRARVVVAVRTPPERGKANAEVLDVLAEALDLPPGALRITAGAASGRKTVEAARLGRADAIGRLRLASKG